MEAGGEGRVGDMVYSVWWRDKEGKERRKGNPLGRCSSAERREDVQYRPRMRENMQWEDSSKRKEWTEYSEVCATSERWRRCNIGIIKKEISWKMWRSMKEMQWDGERTQWRDNLTERPDGEITPTWQRDDESERRRGRCGEGMNYFAMAAILRCLE